MKAIKVLAITLGVTIIILLGVLIFYPSPAKGPTVLSGTNNASSTSLSQ